MAVLAATANGNLTASATWGLVDSTSYLNSEANNTALTTSAVASSAFTPGAITVDGIAVKIASRAASPTGTMTIELFNSTGGSSVASVTVNVSDVPTCTATSGSTTPVSTAEGGWFFVKFSASQTLLAATNYTIRASTSSASQVNLWRNATASNWSRYLRTTGTGAPAAGDDMIITGEWTAAATVTSRTVTMDSTASTAYGSNTTTQVTPAISICKNGTLAFGTSASTAYNLTVKGYIVVYNGGTFNQGVKGGTTIPIGSSAQLNFTVTADGDFGLVTRNGGTRNAGGNPRTVSNTTSYTLLAADAAGGATSLTTAVSTGWLNGDSICLAPTARTNGQFEKVSLTANASGSTLTVGATSFAHSGTSPTQGEVGLLTRNVQVNGVDSTHNTFEYCGNTATVSVDWIEYQYGGSNAVSQKFGLYIDTTTGSFSATNFSHHDDGACAIVIANNSANNFTIDSFVVYNTCLKTTSVGGIYMTSTTQNSNWTIQNGIIIGNSATNGTGLNLTSVCGTIQNISVSGVAYFPVQVAGNGAGNPGSIIGTMSGLTVHSTSDSGAGGVFKVTGQIFGVISSLKVWRSGNYGLTSVTGSSGTNGSGGSAAGSLYPGLRFNNAVFFGNSGSNVLVSNGSGTWEFNNSTFNGDSSFATTNNVGSTGVSTGGLVLVFRSCAFSAVSGILTAATNDFNFLAVVSTSNGIPIVTDNCTFNGSNLYASASAPSVNVGNRPIIAAQNFNGTANDNRSYYASGTSTFALVQTNTSTVYGSNTRSEKMVPATSQFKLLSSSIYVACASGKTATITVQVQKDSSYAGNAPRLILKRQDSMGVTSDTVLATFSSGANVWQALSGSTSAAPQDGVFEFVIDCDGTAGSVFVGDATATVT